MVEFDSAPSKAMTKETTSSSDVVFGVDITLFIILNSFALTSRAGSHERSLAQSDPRWV